MATEIEKIVVRIDFLAIEHFLPDRSDRVVQTFSSRPDGCRKGRRRPDRSAFLSALINAIFERLAIDFASTAKRQLGQADKTLRHTMCRQHPGQLCTYLCHARCADVIPHQSLVPLVILFDHHDGLLQPGYRVQARFDVAQLNAKTANLDLIIDTPDIAQASVELTHDKVASAVQPRLGRNAVWVGKKRLRGALIQIQITLCHPAPANVKLAGYTAGKRVQIPVKDIHSDVVQRPQYQGTSFIPVIPGRCIHRRFGRTVTIEETSAGCPGLGDVGRTGFTGADDDFKLGKLGMGEQAQGRRRDLQMSDTLLAQKRHQIRPREQLFRGCKYQCGAADQYRKHLATNPVEDWRKVLQLARLTSQFQCSRKCIRGVIDIALRNHYPLGLPGRARGVKNIGQILRLTLAGRSRPFALVTFEVVDQQRLQPQSGKLVCQASMTHHAVQCCVFDHVAQRTFHRILRIQGDKGTARLEDAKHACHQIGMPSSEQADVLTGLHTLLYQRVGDAVG